MLATALDTRWLAAAALLLAGTSVTKVSAPARTPTNAAATKVTLTTLPGRVPELVAYRAKTDRTWTILERHDDHYDFNAATRYTLVVVCSRHDTTAQLFTFELAARDTTSLIAPCRVDQRTRITVPVRFVDPAVSAVVEHEHAGVWRDGNGNIVDRDNEVSLPAGRHDWITTSDKPLRIRLEHDVVTTPARRLLDIRGGGPVDRRRIHAPENVFASVSFLSKNGTEFSGLGPARNTLSDDSPDHAPNGESETWNVVPFAQRRPGDRDLVNGTDILDDQTLLGVTTAIDTPGDVTLSMPTARPIGEVGNRGELRWKRAGDPDLVTIYRASDDETPEQYTWETLVSKRWLDGATSYRPFDPSTIPGWRWPNPGEHPWYVWISWAWTSSASSLPFDPYKPPVGVTYSRISSMLR